MPQVIQDSARGSWESEMLDELTMITTGEAVRDKRRALSGTLQSRSWQ